MDASAPGQPLIERYLSIRQAYAPSFSSDGARLAFLTDITGVPQVWRVEIPEPGGRPLWPEALTFGEDRVQGVWCSPAAGDDRLVFARDRGGDENAQLGLLHLEGGEETPLTRGYEAAMHTFGVWLPDGGGIAFSANRRDPGLFDLYTQPVGEIARPMLENETPGYLLEPTFSPDGDRLVVRHVLSSFEQHLMEVNLLSGSSRRLTPANGQARYVSPFFAPGGRTVFLLTDRDSDFLYLGKLDVESLEIEPIVSPQADVELLTLSPDGTRLVYALNLSGTSELHACSPDGRGDQTAPLPPGAPGVVGWFDGALAFAPDSRRMAFSLTRATRTSDIYVWDFESNQVTAATRSSHAGLDPRSFVAPEPVRYPTFDQDGSGAARHIPAWLYRPSGPGEGRPAIVFVHGGPESQFRPFFHTLIQYFLARGYAVLAPNVRGSTGYGTAYSHLDDRRLRMDSVADLAYAARWLAARPEIDGERLAVLGGSYGGYMVLAGLTSNPELWAAGVEIVGISSFVTFLENTSDYRRVHREAEYGSLAEDRDFLEGISPLRQVERIQAPLMIVHGANDPRVPLGEARQLAAALEARGVPVELMIFEDEGHGLVKLKNRLAAYPAMAAFLDQHLAAT